MPKKIMGISGVSGSSSAYVISELIKQNKGHRLVIAATESRAKKLADDLSFFVRKNVILMPAEDNVFIRYEAKNHDTLVDRLMAMQALRTDSECIIVAPVSAVVKNMIPHKIFESKDIILEFGMETDPTKLKEQLVDLGYERMSMVEEKGQFSIRGGIVDVFVPEADVPYRIELFDTEIDSIRSFDIMTQRSLENLREIKIGPAQAMLASREVFKNAREKVFKDYSKQIERLNKREETSLESIENLRKNRDSLCEYIDQATNIQLLENYVHYFYEKPEHLYDYIEGGQIIIEDPDRIYEFIDSRNKEMKEDFEIMLERGQLVPGDSIIIPKLEDFFNIYEKEDVCIITPFPKVVKGIREYSEIHDFHSRQMLQFNGKLDNLLQEIRSYIKKNYDITIACSTEERLKNIDEFLSQNKINKNIKYEIGVLSGGIDFPEQKICYISDNDIFGGQKNAKSRKAKKIHKGKNLESFTDLVKGDFVVHEGHGIGKFLGVKQLDIRGKKKDYLQIKYAGSDMLYVPVEQFDIVQKYIGADGVTPKINKLSGNEWKATKARAKAAIAEMADELIKLYAQREVEKGYAFGEDTKWQKEFEDSFPYVETEDQLRSIEEIKRDMEKPLPMDRLLCGDVGFGKTEVAARAMFKCIAAGKQAAILVPTTLLANQHYYTLKDRFEKFPLKVEMLSRFRSDKEQQEILEQLKNGKIDLIIGTHRLLSKDVVFKDLGLLVVDEEQRFGVAHKEKIKQIKQNIDVLTLSATPIPRTLNMSLTGIKDMSVIEEPPEERYPVQTYVMEQDSGVIRDAILREMDRGGQVFVIYNRVRGIAKLADKIRELVPEAGVVVGHGQMNEQSLENIMFDFVNHEYDVLVATTIVESGIDVPNANTLIVLDADRYGLSQLYQIRGRVGRSNRMAYAYLMYQKDKVLNETAEKRLRAIREFTEFGSGFKVAMRDLQIRGAGNLLGSEQSGHMMNIGYELYCKIVNDEINRLKGETVRESEEEVSVELAVSANIPDWYVEDEIVKIQTYKKIANINSDESMDDMYDELQDRFGDVPRETENLLKVSYIRSLSENLSLNRIYEQMYERSKRVIFAFDEKNSLKAIDIINVNAAFPRAFVHGGSKPFIRIPMNDKSKLDDAIRLLKILKGDEDAIQ